MYQVKTVYLSSTKTEYYVLNVTTAQVQSVWRIKNIADEVARRLNQGS